MLAPLLALLLASAPGPGCAALDAPTLAELPTTSQAFRVSGAVLELVDVQTGEPRGAVLAGPGRYYTALGGERLDNALGKLQVRLAEAEARAAQGPTTGVSHQTVLLVGAVALAVGLAGGVALARFR